jgi:hypothetical protein
VVAAVQGVVLTVAASGLFTRLLTIVAVAVALAMLIESFGRDIVWQYPDADRSDFRGNSES